MVYIRGHQLDSSMIDMNDLLEDRACFMTESGLDMNDVPKDRACCMTERACFMTERGLDMNVMNGTNVHYGPAW